MRLSQKASGRPVAAAQHHALQMETDSNADVNPGCVLRKSCCCQFCCASHSCLQLHKPTPTSTRTSARTCSRTSALLSLPRKLHQVAFVPGATKVSVINLRRQISEFPDPTRQGKLNMSSWAPKGGPLGSCVGPFSFWIFGNIL